MSPPHAFPRGGLSGLLIASMAIQYAVGGAVLPFITLVLRDRGFDYSQIGWTFFASSLAASTLPSLWGTIGDRWMRLEFLLAILHVAGALLLYFIAENKDFSTTLVLFAFFASINTPSGALLSAVAYQRLEAPDRQFGRLRLWGSVGWMLPSAPITIWLSYTGGTDVTFTLHLAAGLEVVAALALLALARSGTPTSVRRSGEAPGDYRGALGTLFRRPGFPLFLGVIFLVHASFAILFYYSPPLLETAGFARRDIGPLQCLGVITEIPVFFTLHWVLRRMGYRGTLALGCAFLLARQLTYALPSPPWILASSYVLAGGCVVFYLTAGSLAMNSLAGRTVRATAQTLLTLAGPGLGQMFAHQVTGYLVERAGVGMEGVFAFASGCVALALVLLALLGRKGLFDAAPEAPERGLTRGPVRR